MEADFEGLKLEKQLCFPLYAASREVIKRYRPHLDEIGLTYTQYIAMMVIWEKRCLSAGELGRKLYLDSGTLTSVLKSLEAKGYIRRYRSAEDERVLLLELCEAGEALRERAAAIPQKMALCVGLEAGDAAQLYRLLYGLLEKLSLGGVAARNHRSERVEFAPMPRCKASK